MKSFIMNEGSINQFCNDLERLKSKFHGSERVLLDDKGEYLKFGWMKENRIYVTEDFRRLFKVILDTFKNIDEDIKKDE